MIAQQLLGNPEQEILTVVRWHGTTAPSVILCPGLATSKSGSPSPRYFFTTVASRCYQAGMNVFQFDYHGHGDSAGKDSDVTLDSLLYSLHTVVAHAEELGCRTLAYVGLGVGNALLQTIQGRQSTAAIVQVMPSIHVMTRFAEIFGREERECAGADGKIIASFEDADKAQYWASIIGFTRASTRSAIPIECLRQLAHWQSNRVGAQTDVPTLILEAEELAGKTASEYKRITDLPEKLDSIAAQTAAWLAETCTARDAGMTAASGPGSMPARDLAGRRYGATDTVPLSFESGDGHVLGVLHIPRGSAGRRTKTPCVIYETGLGGDRLDVHECAKKLGYFLADRGFYVLRYDPRGAGVSSGEFYDSAWSRRLEDLQSAMAALRAIPEVDSESIAIVSNSAGARIACLAANRWPEIKTCVLWSPDLAEDSMRGDGSAEDSSRIGHAPTHRFRRNAYGKLVTTYSRTMWLGIDYFYDLRQYDFMEEYERCSRPLLVVFGLRDSLLAPGYIQAVETVAAGDERKAVLELDDEHQYERCQQYAMDMTADWIEQHMGPTSAARWGR